MSLGASEVMGLYYTANNIQLAKWSQMIYIWGRLTFVFCKLCYLGTAHIKHKYICMSNKLATRRMTPQWLLVTHLWLTGQIWFIRVQYKNSKKCCPSVKCKIVRRNNDDICRILSSRMLFFMLITPYLGNAIIFN